MAYISPSDLRLMGYQWGGNNWKSKLAKELGVDSRTVRRWATKETNPSFRELKGNSAFAVLTVLKKRRK